MSLVRTDVRSHKGLYGPDATPTGYGPSDFQSAYNLPSATAGNGQTVAIVDAYDDPNAEADLANYRTQYGLPACTSANGCFQKVNQEGQQGSYPSPDSGWAEEESLDLDMVSAICPNCHILLVEANSNSNSDLYAAEDEAVTLGAKYVSNSWAGCEYSGETSDDQYFNHPGVAITAAGGDNGYDNYQLGCTSPDFPASSQYVTSVGGTALTRNSSVPRGWTETTWSPDPAATGSGCSQYETKPAWQTDPGCADRMTNDVSADSDPATGAAIYDSYSAGGWLVVGGTSQATPIIAATYALAGTPAAGTYPSSYPYADPSALNDVTSGSDYNQSCTPAYFCTAGPGYDGPTGLGTPDGVAAFTPAFFGTVTGTVTDAGSGQPLAGAAVTVGDAAAKTNSSGQYSVAVPVGSYTVTAAAFGYATQNASGVQVSQGQATTENFALVAAPEVTLSGTVTDGSGHGWPLYATVSVPGDPTVAHTDPVTGHYTLSVPDQAAYQVTVAAVGAGYQQLQQQVSLGTSNQTQNFTVPVDTTACDATGYTPAGEAFTGWSGRAPQDGWTVTDGKHNGETWNFSNPSGLTPPPGGDASFASVDSGYYGAGHAQDTSLVSPVMDLSAVTDPAVTFGTYLYGIANFGLTINVDVSTDGGQTWTTVWDPTLGPIYQDESIPIPQAAGQPDARVRFHYTSGTAGGGWWAIDNVLVGSPHCTVVPGGLIAGQVTDANTGHALDGATVANASDPAQTTTTSSVPHPGFYEMFTSPAGSQQVSVSAPYYPTASKTIGVAADGVTVEDIALIAPKLAISPSGLSATEQLGSHHAATEKVTVTNTGTAPATVDPTAAPAGFTLAGQPAAQRMATPPAPGSPLRLVKGHYSLRPGQAGHAAHSAGTVRAPAATGSSWTTGADYPTGIAGSAVATNPGTGWVYSAGGFTGAGATGAAYTYNPYTKSWKHLPHMPAARQEAVAAFTGGKLYVIGGWDAAANPKPQLAVYDPATRTWSHGPSEPVALAASAVTVLNGNIYVIGGCDASGCGSTAVQVFDTSTGAWSQAAGYPEVIAYEGCGTIDGKIYCAGGSTGTVQGTSHGYVYDPASNVWSAIPSMPADLWGMAYSASGGQLELSGGITLDGTTLTNQGFTYIPGTGWSPLPNSPVPVYRAGSGCGLYEIGGRDATNAPTGANQVLPGYNDCGSGSSVPWLTVTPASSTLAPGQSETLTVSLNASAPNVTQPGTYTASLALVNGTPYQVTGDPVSVSMTVTPPSTWGEVTGRVTGLACNSKVKPLAGATVAVTGKTGSWTLTTGPDGQYALWAGQGQNPLDIIAQATGWQTKSTTARITAGQVTTANLTLSPAGGCAGARDA